MIVVIAIRAVGLTAGSALVPRLYFFRIKLAPTDRGYFNGYQ